MAAAAHAQISAKVCLLSCSSGRTPPCRDKTAAGTNRTIPLSRRAMAVLEMWADNFPHRKPKR
ncbi:MAG TPA: hypothetical protein VHY48_03035 [Acidobacteriaceae bacterium]|nr:hypothetical protein [Acidobacteriaceae bacterium]